jgi:anti-sigma B factor antagonist
MKYSIDKQEKFSIFALQEENLNSLIAHKVKAEFTFMGAEGILNLIVDLSHVRFVDSSGLSALLFGNRTWENMAGTFILTGVNSSNVIKLIEISKLLDVFNIVPTLEEAIEMVYMEEVEREINSEEE